MNISTFSMYHKQINNMKSLSLQNNEQLTKNNANQNIIRPSDSPSRVSDSLVIKNMLNDIERNKQCRDDAAHILKCQHDVGNGIQEILTGELKIAFIEMQNDINLKGNNKNILIEKLKNIHNKILTLCNQKDDNIGYIFSGASRGKLAFDKEGVYIGSPDEVIQNIGSNTEITTFYPGNNLFSGNKDSNLLGVLSKAIDRMGYDLNNKENLNILRESFSDIDKVLNKTLGDINVLQTKIACDLNKIDDLCYSDPEKRNELIAFRQEIIGASDASSIERFSQVYKMEYEMEIGRRLFFSLQKLSFLDIYNQ